MTQTFKCPSCGAPLEIEQDVELSLQPAVTCRFCGQTVIVPEALREREPGAAVYEVRVDAPRTARWVWAVIGLVVAGSIVIGLIGAVLSPLVGLFAVRESLQVISTSAPIPTVDLGFLSGLAVTPSPTPGMAQIALQFGSEGIGPGRFDDARSIAVDGQGRIYVGEYSGGRIQVFDAGGNFLTQWTADAEFPLRGMAADRDGTVYVVQRGQISRYAGQSGEMLGEIPLSEDAHVDDVAVSATGELAAVTTVWSDDILLLDAQGELQSQITGAVSAQTGDPESSLRVAVDGLGGIYVLAGNSSGVFLFSPEGKFLNRFGDAGDQPGQLRGPSALAVDGRGRIYVGDFKGIQVFAPGGRYLGLIEVEGVPSGLVFNGQDELFVVARTQVLRYQLNPAGGG